MKDSSRMLPALAVLVAALACAPPALAHHKAGHGLDAKLRAALDGRVLRTTDGTPLALDKVRGDVIVLNFWATWCAPCRREMPQLDRLHAEIAAKGGRVVAVSIDTESRNVSRFARRHGIRMPIYHDGPEGLAKKLDIDATPFTVVLDRGGRVALTTEGADAASVAKVIAVTRELVARKPVATRGTP